MNNFDEIATTLAKMLYRMYRYAENRHDSNDQIPANLPYRKAIVTMEDIDGNLHTNWWMVAEYRGCYVLTHEEMDSAIVAEPGAKITVTYMD